MARGQRADTRAVVHDSLLDEVRRILTRRWLSFLPRLVNPLDSRGRQGTGLCAIVLLCGSGAGEPDDQY